MMQIKGLAFPEILNFEYLSHSKSAAVPQCVGQGEEA